VRELTLHLLLSAQFHCPNFAFFISYFFLSNQNSPLFLAAQAGHLLAVNALVAAKADLKKRNV
jgi:hypothetical protein